MYTVPKFIPKVYLIHRDGRRWEFKNIEEAANTLWRQNYLGRYNEAPIIGNNFKEARQHDYYAEQRLNNDLVGGVIYYEYIVRDELGETITVDELKSARRNAATFKPSWLFRYDARDIITERHFRSIPIPYTGRRGNYGYYRHVRTTAEIRENEFLKYDEDAVEYDVKPRARRTQNVPSAWDDIGRNDFRDHNWKRHRKTQWKEKK